MTTPNLFRAASQALYGHGTRWIDDIALFLDVAPRTIRRWDADPNSVPANVWAELAEALRLHRLEVSALLLRLGEKVPERAESGEG